jgi:hypothetical protein
MKISKFAVMVVLVVTLVTLFGCGSAQRVRVIEIENKGTSMGVSTPDWIRLYTARGISALQAQSEFRDKYCIIGEETGVNLQFVRTWADNFSAQQRIGAMLRTSIATQYQARVQAAAQTAGGPGAGTESMGMFQQEIDSTINAIVNVSYSGAQREADWWSLRRRIEADGTHSDQYTAYVLYTIPRAEMNRQIAQALETSVSRDSALYEITIQMAQQIMQNGIADWGRD